MRIRRFQAREFVAMLVLLCIAVTILFSAWMMVSHAGHRCTGEHCLGCAQIHIIGKLLKQLGIAGADVLAVFYVFLAVFVPIWCVNTHRHYMETPVTLKVRMNI